MNNASQYNGKSSVHIVSYKDEYDKNHFGNFVIQNTTRNNKYKIFLWVSILLHNLAHKNKIISKIYK